MPYICGGEKKCLQILFIALVLNNSCFNELCKLPALITHYIEHHRLDNRVGIIEFMAMHYWGEDINDNDQKKDMQLPFKNVDENIYVQLSLPVTKPMLEKQSFHIKILLSSISQVDYLSDPALASLFWPPRA